MSIFTKIYSFGLAAVFFSLCLLPLHAQTGAFTVTFDHNDGSGEVTTLTRSYGAKIGSAVPSVSRTGHTFDGWFTDEGREITGNTYVEGDIFCRASWTPLMYTVSFKGNGGVVSPNMLEVEYGSAVGALPVPSRTGYTFNGWFTSSSGGTKIDENTVITSAVSYYAQWTVQCFKVRFDACGGSVSESQREVNYGTAVGTLPVPEFEGYRFLGWFTAASGGTEIVESTKIYSEQVCYAQWRENVHTVVFNPGGGAAVDEPTRSVEDGSAIGPLPVPVREGYDFLGWFVSTSGGEAVSETKVIDSSCTFYAQWSVRSYEVVFDSADGSGDSVTLTRNYGEIVGDVLPSVSRTGYKFLGWFDGDGKEVTALSVVRGDLLCRASWQIITLTVSFKGNGGVVSPNLLEVEYGSAVGALPVPSRTGYTFDGWFTSSSGGTKIDENTVITSAVSYYAQWTALKMTVFFDACGGSVTELSREVDYETAIGALPVPERDKYRFLGWYTAASNGNKIEETTLVTGEMTCFAQWEQDVFTVCFSPEKGKLPEADLTREISNGEALGALPVPERTGYVFNGWFTAVSGGERVGEDYPVEKDTTFYAQWSVRSCEVVFDSADGSGDSVTLTRNYGEIVGDVLPSVSRTGYKFLGWFDGDGKEVTALSVVRGDLLCRASWQIITLSVSLKGNGGVVSPNFLEVEYGSAIGALPVPSRTGYTFDGWFTAPSGGEAVTASSKIVQSISIYARWTALKCKVEFDANGGVCAESVRWCEYEREIGILPEATRDGYDFTGWYTSAAAGDGVTEKTLILKDTVVYAQWKIHTFDISFNANGGSVSERVRNVDYNSALGVLPVPVRAGYTFKGWYTSPEGGVKISGAELVFADAEYFARWQINSYTVLFNPVRGIVGETSRKVEYGSKVGELPVPYWEGYDFVGWFTARVDGRMISADTVIYSDTEYFAHWVKSSDPSITGNYFLYDEQEGSAPQSASSVYDGYLYNSNGDIAGIIEVKVSKPKQDKELRVLTAKTTAYVTLLGKKKETIKGSLNFSTGEMEAVSKTSVILHLKIGEFGMSGSYGVFLIDGARRLFSSKDDTEKEAADAISDGWFDEGALNLMWEGGTLTITASSKGKVKISGVLLDGTKVSAKGQLIIGEQWCCIPVVYAKKEVELAFSLWLSSDIGNADVLGLPGKVYFGRPGKLSKGALFMLDEEDPLWLKFDGPVLREVLPLEIGVSVDGKKWVVADGKRGKVKYLKGTTDINWEAAKLNPSGLKLTYKSKDGSFKGSFKVYYDIEGRLKSKTVNVTGVTIDGCGYGTASVKKIGSTAIIIE